MEHDSTASGGALSAQTLRRYAMRSIGGLSAALVGVLGLAGTEARSRTSKGKKARGKHGANTEKKKGGGQGPPGPLGPMGSMGPRGSSNGLTGPTGPDGIPGPTGKSSGAFLGVTTVQAGAMVQHGLAGAVKATCPTVPADQQIIATGGGINATDGNFMISYSAQSSPTSWTIVATNIGGRTSRLGAYVVCMWFSK
jgi:hypothetical protein